MKRIFLYCVLPTILLAGCAPCSTTLFKQIEAGTDYTVPARPEFVIEPGDEVEITVSGLETSAVAAFQVGSRIYRLEQDGTVVLPVIGKQAIGGLTERQAAIRLTELVGRLVQNPRVQVTLQGATVTVLGEVYNPGTFPIDQPVTLLSILSRAGDMMPSANRSNVMVQRTERGKVTIYRVNLLTDELYRSPVYYIRKGDVIYVSPRWAARPKQQ